MGVFINSLQVEKITEDPPEWKLTAPLLFDSAVLDEAIEVPAGFVTDFASVPRIPFAYWLAGGIGDAAAVLHDFLYRRGDLFPDVTRQGADRVFLEALAASGVAQWRRELMYLAVRIWGFWAWRNGIGRA